MGKAVSTYVIALVAFCAFDFVWLSVTAERLYKPALGDLLAPNFRLGPSIAFYLIYVAGLVALAVFEGATVRPWRGALIRGAIYGFCAYGTYDLTNQATLRQWSAELTAFDMAWGCVLSAWAATVSAALSARFFPAATARTG